MRAMVLEAFGRPLELREVPVPQIGPGEALIRMRACGVCGTDLKIVAGALKGAKVPWILGHEPMGEVVEVATEGLGIATGDRVVVSTYLPCGHCKFCSTGRTTLCLNLKGHIGFSQDGGFADYVKAPAADLIKIPDNVTDDSAAVLSCAVGTVFHALRSRAMVKAGDWVLVMGVGGLGIHAVQVARLAGANVIAADIDERRLNMAREYGADQVVFFHESGFADQMRKLTGTGVAVIVETVGLPQTIAVSLDSLEPGGRLIITGYHPGKPFTALPSDFVLRELEIMGTRAVTRQELVDLVGLVESGRLKPVVTQRYPLPEVNAALDALARGQILGRAVVVI